MPSKLAVAGGSDAGKVVLTAGTSVCGARNVPGAAAIVDIGALEDRLFTYEQKLKNVFIYEQPPA